MPSGKNKKKEREQRRARAFSLLEDSYENKNKIIIQTSTHETQTQKIPCSYCRTLLDIKDKICPYCGAPVRERSQVASAY